ncbi:NUDIX hydrolase [Rothia nasimurium]|uniref:NUDIX hydrolase n=1 Tax=Rothia nasimurium TaxID=85336 RepID=UPI00117A1DF3|nr:NUDIX hydrolase [Rothia nasimurium]
MSSQPLYTGALKRVPPPASVPLAPRPATANLPVIKTHPIPAHQQECALTWLEEGQGTLRPAKPAAAVVFVRDGANGVETYMTYRVKSPMGRIAFPGGLGVAEDAAPVGWVGPTGEYWAQAFAEDNLGAAAATVVTATREVFEETGVLLAGDRESSTIELTSGHECMVSRQAVAQQDKTFADYLDRRGLKIRADLLKPLARWQSPGYFHKRYDVHYFTCAVPVGQSPTLLKDKGVWGSWVSPRELVADTASTALGDEIGQPDTVGVPLCELVTPGVMYLLEQLAAASGAVAFLSKRRQVSLYKPEVRQDASGTCYLAIQEKKV